MANFLPSPAPAQPQVGSLRTHTEAAVAVGGDKSLNRHITGVSSVHNIIDIVNIWNSTLKHTLWRACFHNLQVHHITYNIQRPQPQPPQHEWFFLHWKSRCCLKVSSKGWDLLGWFLLAVEVRGHHGSISHLRRCRGAGEGGRQEPSPGRWQVWPHCVAPSTASRAELETKVRNQRA